jgi:hypothetical protein
MTDQNAEAVDPAVFTTNPHRLVFQAVLDAPVENVFDAVAAHPETWHRWFPLVGKDCQYTTPAPHGVGSERYITAMGWKLRERIIAWDEPHCWAFYVLPGQIPGKLFAEEYRFEPVDGKTRFTWTVATEGPRAARLGMRVAGRLTFKRAVPRLERELTSRRT